MSRIHNTGW
jgi:hypothetical protein